MNVASAGNDVGSLLAEIEPMSFDDDPVGEREQPTEQVGAHTDHACHLYFGVPSAKAFAVTNADCSRSMIESLGR